MKIDVEFTMDINASSEKIYDILADLEAWPMWSGTPFVKLSSPEPIKEGTTFVARLGGLKWQLMIKNADRPKRLVWGGYSIGLKCIHEWMFMEDGRITKVITKETMTGWMLFITYPLAKKRLSIYDEKWLADLKVRAEST